MAAAAAAAASLGQAAAATAAAAPGSASSASSTICESSFSALGCLGVPRHCCCGDVKATFCTGTGIRCMAATGVPGRRGPSAQAAVWTPCGREGRGSARVTFAIGGAATTTGCTLDGNAGVRDNGERDLGADLGECCDAGTGEMDLSTTLGARTPLSCQNASRVTHGGLHFEGAERNRCTEQDGVGGHAGVAAVEASWMDANGLSKSAADPSGGAAPTATAAWPVDTPAAGSLPQTLGATSRKANTGEGCGDGVTPRMCPTASEIGEPTVGAEAKRSTPLAPVGGWYEQASNRVACIGDNGISVAVSSVSRGASCGDGCGVCRDEG